MAKASANEKASRPEWIKLYGGATLAGVALLAITYQFVDPAPPSALRFATGGPQGAYHAYGKRYREILARHGVELELVNSSGSVENLDLLSRGDSGVEVAFAQGGTGADAGDALVSLASLYYEPAWLFHRDSVTFATLGELAGRRVAVGPQGSGTRALALALMADNGIAPEQFALSDLGGADALSALQAGEIDAWFTVAGVNSELVRRAFAADGIRAYGVERAEAYARRHRYLSALVLPQGTLDLAANVPPRDLRLVSPTAALVIHEDLHSALQYLLLEAATEIHSPGGILEEPGSFPSPHLVDLPVSETARRYFDSGPPFLRRLLPFWAATLIDRLAVMLLPLIAFALPLFRFMPAVYRWRMRSRIYRWYRELRPLELQVRSGLDPAEAERMLDRLDTIEHALAGLSVPSAYAEEFYQLRLHIDLVRSEAMRVRARGNDEAGA